MMKSITPAAKISALFPSYFLLGIYGAMYPSVPNLVFKTPVLSFPSNWQEKPKSAILSMNICESNTF